MTASQVAQQDDNDIAGAFFNIKSTQGGSDASTRGVGQDARLLTKPPRRRDSLQGLRAATATGPRGRGYKAAGQDYGRGGPAINRGLFGVFDPSV